VVSAVQADTPPARCFEVLPRRSWQSSPPWTIRAWAGVCGLCHRSWDRPVFTRFPPNTQGEQLHQPHAKIGIGGVGRRSTGPQLRDPDPKAQGDRDSPSSLEQAIVS